MKIALDTNVILDAVLERGDYAGAQTLVLAVASGELEGVVTANSITDIFYIAKKLVGDLVARQLIGDILAVFDIAPVDGEICATALNLPMTDYEDAVMAACAHRENADYIATNDHAFLRAESPVPAKTVAELLEAL